MPVRDDGRFTPREGAPLPELDAQTIARLSALNPAAVARLMIVIIRTMPTLARALRLV